MNWEALGAIGELIGAVTVLVTLLYLAKQIRDNSNMLSISAYQTALDGYNDLASKFFQDPDNARISGNLFTDGFSKLDVMDEYRLSMMWRSYMNQNLKLLRLYELGVLPKKDWDWMANEIKHLVSSTQFGIKYKDDNPLFEDVWRAIDIQSGDRISRFVKE